MFFYCLKVFSDLNHLTREATAPWGLGIATAS